MKKLHVLLVLITFTATLSCRADISKPLADNVTPTESNSPFIKEHHIKVALLLDTSNSMDGLIDQAKAQRFGKSCKMNYPMQNAEMKDRIFKLHFMNTEMII
jgi:hypothetical protein